MLTKCPECELQVSDKAFSCPHCGYPLQENTKPRQPRKSSKRRRLPNGFGQISEIKNRNLRNPFRAMVTVGKTSTGKPICKPLKPESYFSSYNEAYAALVEYNKNPYDLSPSITMKELYEKWAEEYFKTSKSYSYTQGIKLAWLYCSSIYDMRVSDVRIRHIKGCMEEGKAVVRGKEQFPNVYSQNKIKALFNLLLDYALEQELVERNYARSFSLSDEITKEISVVKKEHIAYNEEEIDLLWQHVDTTQYVDMILIQCYSGWRPQEVCLLQLKNINLNNQTFVGGMKTDSGLDRIVPIHSKIQSLVLRKYKEAKLLGSEFLFNTNSTRDKKPKPITYSVYLQNYNKVREKLKFASEHRPHDGRIHFITMAKKYNVDEYAIKYMVGHAISDITERVYTKRELEWFKEEIEKIK